MDAAETFLELVETIATPIALVVVAHRFQRRAKTFEAAIAEKARYYASITPHLNRIFSYRQRVGDFLDRSPEDVLRAKREADHLFWTHQYIWSNRFAEFYLRFMSASFRVWGAEGSRASIRADAAFHPIAATTAGWVAFTGEEVDRRENARLYGAIQEAIAEDLGLPRGAKSGTKSPEALTRDQALGSTIAP